MQAMQMKRDAELSVPRNRNRRKIASVFKSQSANRKVQIAEIAEKSPENRRKNRRKIAAIFWGAEYKSQRFRVFKIAAFSGR